MLLYYDILWPTNICIYIYIQTIHILMPDRRGAAGSTAADLSILSINSSNNSYSVNSNNNSYSTNSSNNSYYINSSNNS